MLNILSFHRKMSHRGHSLKNQFFSIFHVEDFRLEASAIGQSSFVVHMSESRRRMIIDGFSFFPHFYGQTSRREYCLHYAEKPRLKKETDTICEVDSSTS